MIDMKVRSQSAVSRILNAQRPISNEQGDAERAVRGLIEPSLGLITFGPGHIDGQVQIAIHDMLPSRRT